jgi:hypothetical protein
MLFSQGRCRIWHVTGILPNTKIIEMLLRFFEKVQIRSGIMFFVTKAYIVCRGPVYLSLFPSAVNSHAICRVIPLLRKDVLVTSFV